MGDLNIIQAALPNPNDIYAVGKTEQDNIRELKVGEGSTIFYTDKEGSRWGNIIFDDAKAWVKVDGTAKFKTPGGNTILDTSSLNGDYLEVINNRLNTSSKTILSDFTFSADDYAGAFKSGNPTWNEVTGLITGGSGVIINARGILGAKNGVATFTLDATTGDATFAGNLSAATGTFAGSLSAATGTLGALTIASNGNIKFGKTAYTDDTNAGFWLGDVSGTAKLNIGSSASKYLHYDGTDLTMLGGIITGATVQTAATGVRTRMTSGNGIQFMNGDSEEAYMWGNGSGLLSLDADSAIQLSADGAGDYIGLFAGTGGMLLDCTQDIIISANDSFELEFNDGGGSHEGLVVNDGTTHTRFKDNGDLYISNGDCYFDDYFTYDYAEYFESTLEFSNEKIPTGTTVVLENGKIRPATNGEIPFGVISESSFVHAGGAGSKEWKGKYLRDELGRRIIQKREKWYIKGKNKKIEKGWSDEKSSPKGSKKLLKDSYIINPEWNENQTYIPRKDRPEWNDVGLVGQLPILKGQPINPNWVKMKSLGENYDQWLIK